MATSHDGFLAHRPPPLHPVSETQAFSGSTTSSGSSSYSATSAYLERLSRGSSGSAYLTDITPPVTPLNSKPGDGHPRGLNRGYNPRPLFSTFQDKLGTSDSLWMRSENNFDGEDIDEEGRDPFDAVATKLSRTMPSINSRRALEIMERRKGPLSNESSPNNSHSYSIAASRIIVTEHDIVEASQGEIQTTAGDDYQVTSDISCYASAIDHEDMVNQETMHPQMPPKPALRATELDSDCSPLLLSSPSVASVDISASLSHFVLSPIQPIQLNTHSVTISSPAIYSDCSLNGHSPDGSPLVAISALMFSSRFSHRTSVLTGEDLDLPTLLRLEVAASIEGMPPPDPSVVGLGLGVPVHQPSSPLDDSFSSYYGNSFESCSLEDQVQEPLPVAVSNQSRTSASIDVSSVKIEEMLPKSAVAAAARSSAGHIIGLGFGSVVESGLHSSSSVTRLDSILAQQDALALAEMKKDIVHYTDPLPASCHFQPCEEHTIEKHTIPTIETSLLRKLSFRPRKRLPHPSSNDCEPNTVITDTVNQSTLDASSIPTTFSGLATESHGPSPHEVHRELLHPSDPINIENRSPILTKPRIELSPDLLQPNSQIQLDYANYRNTDKNLLPSPAGSLPLSKPLYIPRRSSFALLDATSPRPELETFIRSGFLPFALSRKEDLAGGCVDYFHESSYVLGAEKYLSPPTSPLQPAAAAPSPTSSRLTAVSGAVSGSDFVEGLSSPSTQSVDINANTKLPRPSEPKLTPPAKVNAQKPKPFLRLFNFTKRCFPAKFRRRVRNLVMVPRDVAV